MNIDTQSEIWINELLSRNNCTDMNELPYSALMEEMDDIEGSILNERIWSLGAGVTEVTVMHLENIEALDNYFAILDKIRLEKKEQHLNIIENKNNPERKDIRFINSHYEEIFKIPDGGFITITRNDGEQIIRECIFIDETHTSIGGHIYHICQFAEMMERSDNKYTPCPAPEKVVGYMITDRIPIKNKEFVLAHNPNAASPFVTWVRNKDYPGYEIGHYWSDRRNAKTDLFRRADAELTGKPYDHTKLLKHDRDTGSR
jgi:hypothetical protein